MIKLPKSQNPSPLCRRLLKYIFFCQYSALLRSGCDLGVMWKVHAIMLVHIGAFISLLGGYLSAA